MPARPPAPDRTFDLARMVAPVAGPILELRRRFLADEARLCAELGPDDPPTFDDFIDWVVMKAGSPPHRPPGSDRDPDARARRSTAQRARRDRERAASGA